MGLFGRKDSGAKAEDPFYNRKPIPGKLEVLHKNNEQI